MRTEIMETANKRGPCEPTRANLDMTTTGRRGHRIHRGLVVLAAASLLAAASAGADSGQKDPASEDWSQQVDENDLRAVGYVMSIGDHYFTLHIDGGGDEEFRFDSSRNPEIWEDLKIGKRVQVWYDPERQSRDEVGEAWYYWAHHFMFQEDKATEDDRAVSESKEEGKATQDDGAQSDGRQDHQ